MPLLFESRRMSTMPKKIDPEVKARAVRMVTEHQQEYASLTAASAAVAKRLGVGGESVRRWVLQAQIDSGQREGPSSAELAEIKALKATVRRLEQDNAILKAATVFFAGVDGRRTLTPEGLYGRRKMTAYLRRSAMPEASAGSVDRAMRTLGLVGVRRDKTTRTTIPAKDGIRAGDLLNRQFTAPAPNRVWVTDFTYVRTWAGFCYVAFIVDIFAQKIVAWHAATSKATDLVMIPLRMALWARDREGHRPAPGQLICHSDAGSIHVGEADRAPRARGDPTLDRDRRRRLR